MKLSSVASKPQLIKFELNDEDTIKEFGEPLEFYSYDRQPLNVFIKLANADHNDVGQMINLTRELILDEEGKQIITDEIMLPGNILIRVIGKVVETLGK